MNEYLVSLLCMWIPNLMSAISCLILFYYYSKISNKAIGLKMIFVMSFFDFLLSATTISYYICLNIDSQSNEPGFKRTVLEFLEYVSEFSLRFALIWACNMAFFLYRLLSMKDMVHPQVYFVRSLLVTIVLSTALAFW